MTEDEMVGWHHQLSGHEFGWTPGVGDRLPPMQETWVQFLGQEDPLEEEMATHFSILA